MIIKSTSVLRLHNNRISVSFSFTREAGGRREELTSAWVKENFPGHKIVFALGGKRYKVRLRPKNTVEVMEESL